MCHRTRGVLLGALLLLPTLAGGLLLRLDHPVPVPPFSWGFAGALALSNVVLSFVVPMVPVERPKNGPSVSYSAQDALVYAVAVLNPLSAIAGVFAGIVLFRAVLSGGGYWLLSRNRRERWREIARTDHRFVSPRAVGVGLRLLEVAGYTGATAAATVYLGWMYGVVVAQVVRGVIGLVLGSLAIGVVDTTIGSGVIYARPVFKGRSAGRSVIDDFKAVLRLVVSMDPAWVLGVVPAVLLARAWGPLGVLVLAAVMGQTQVILRRAVAAGEAAARARQEAEAGYFDGLTGLRNRRGIEREYGRAAISHLAISDIDRFKLVNDTYGHQNGDAVLRAWGDILRSKERPGVWVGRWGGEEFVIALCGASDDEARLLLEGLRRECERFEGVLDERSGERIRFTVSVGWARVAEGEEPATALRRADEALYAAKEGGRNRVVAA